MSSRNLYYTLEAGKAKPDLRKAAAAALKANAREYLAAPIANLGRRGIAKTATEVGKWSASSRNSGQAGLIGQAASILKEIPAREKAALEGLA